MLPRWCNQVFDINLALSTMHRIVQQSKLVKGGRGAKPKRNIDIYALIIALKEYDERTLRGAEMHISRLVCNERIGHSVISYWENKEETHRVIAQFISIAGAMLDRALSSLFTFVDSTKFTSWNIQEIEVTLCNRIAKQSVYPVGISFLRDKVASPVKEAVPKGRSFLYADAWYDDNETIKELFNKGYFSIICPNKRRYSGYWRRKARRIYRQPINRLGYRQRGRGESVFGSLTNQFGDRFNARTTTAMRTRITCRIFSYQIKLLIRCQSAILLLIVRHAQISRTFKNSLAL